MYRQGFGSKAFSGWLLLCLAGMLYLSMGQGVSPFSAIYRVALSTLLPYWAIAGVIWLFFLGDKPSASAQEDLEERELDRKAKLALIALAERYEAEDAAKANSKTLTYAESDEYYSEDEGRWTVAQFSRDRGN